MEALRSGKTLILSPDEVELLVAQLPPGWTHPVLERLSRGEYVDPWDSRTLFDITLRDALDEVAVLTDSVGSNYDIVDVALGRIWSAWPDTDVTANNYPGGPVYPGNREDREGLLDWGWNRRLTVGGLTLGSQPCHEARDRPRRRALGMERLARCHRLHAA